MNLVVGDVFKENLNYKIVCTKAIRIVSYFYGSSYFTENLKNEQIRIYNKIIALTIPGYTCWNSYYFCFHELLESQAALKCLSAKFNPLKLNMIYTNNKVVESNRSSK
ncbi:21043_t:CDS:2, partial [Racocetra persica]